MASKYGITEFADGLGDVVELLDDDGIRSAFKKGEKFEVFKLLVKGAEAYPKIKELVDDSTVFFQEAGDLQREEKDQVLNIIKARFPNPDPLQQKVLDIYETAGFGFGFVLDTISGALQFVEMAKAIFAPARPAGTF